MTLTFDELEYLLKLRKEFLSFITECDARVFVSKFMNTFDYSLEKDFAGSQEALQEFVDFLVANFFNKDIEAIDIAE